MGVALIAWGRFFDRHGNRITVPLPSTEPGVPWLLDFLSHHARHRASRPARAAQAAPASSAWLRVRR